MAITIDGTGSITGISAGGYPDASVTPADLSQPFTAGTAVASTSGTSIDFTSIPSWVKRITVMLNGVSKSGTSRVQVQLGTGGTATTSGYTAGRLLVTTSNNTTRGTVSDTTGFTIDGDDAPDVIRGHLTFTNVSGNAWTCFGGLLVSGSNNGGCCTFGSISLSGTLNMVRITTTNGTDTFDAGTINILYE